MDKVVVNYLKVVNCNYNWAVEQFDYRLQCAMQQLN